MLGKILITIQERFLFESISYATPKNLLTKYTKKRVYFGIALCQRKVRDCETLTTVFSCLHLDIATKTVLFSCVQMDSLLFLNQNSAAFWIFQWIFLFL